MKDISTAKVLIGVPTYKIVQSAAMLSIVGTVLDLANHGVLAHFDGQADMYITIARNQIASLAWKMYQESKVTHLLFLDDDMLVPQGTVIALLKHDLDVVGAGYYGRNLKPIVYDLDPFHYKSVLPRSGIHRVDGTGCGCLLIKCEVLDRMVKHYKHEWWFQNNIVEKGSGESVYLGEDVFFFQLLKNMGIPAYLDCDHLCGHMGTAVVDRNAFESTLSVLIDNVAIARARHFSNLQAKAVQEKASVCAPGCVNCCIHQKVLVDSVDGVVLYNYLRKAQRWNDTLKERLIEEDRIVAQTTAEGYSRPCMFLEGVLCSVYPARPSCCGYCFGRHQERCTENGHVFTILEHDSLHAETAGELIRMLELPANLYTLPGAVLMAERLLAGEPLPPVWSMPIPEQA